ncbi:hypothetical protein PR003_g23197 [Phytophthora rubi]|uniref:RanBP2-type domain-containing protein n=1 Tax=Phytophthora rubi TaxID=129364 RepID=A0A6A4CYU5_9STRA|nr:hypothetical protein PR002_g23388 [Phytophthora rubi]KAE9298587.1 hypothetical protein PR003_g23197 [Phytophthora rubi]
MARIWQTGVVKGSAHRDSSCAQARPRTQKKGKCRSAAKFRTLKKARAVRRAGASSAGTTMTTGVIETRAVGARVSRAAGASAVQEQQSAELMEPSRDVTKGSRTSDTVGARPSQSATEQTDSATNQSVSIPNHQTDDVAEWVCMICTHVNRENVEQCASCNCGRPVSVVDGSTGDTIQEAIAVAQSAIDTDRKVTATNRKDTSTDQLYYPIYDEYYTRKDVTVDTDFAITVETWDVAYINDRREMPLGQEYRVLWVHPDASCKRLYLRTWEPRAKSMEDGFAEEIELVDRWKVSTIATFEDFWRQDKDGVALIGADTEGHCLFNALIRAAELAGRPDVVTQQDVDQFVRDELVLYNRDVSQGTTWKVVRRFLRRLRDAGRDFLYNAVANYNFAIPGRRGARVLEEIELADGIYIVAAYNHSFVGHGIVLTVQGDKRLIYDLKEGKPISSAQGWINFYAFVRPFIVLK